ncbi:MAG: tetratricopeptide repeat protein [Candidatus Cloacimonadota bacterium]|nr:tetratricopeptide repeat protein [Candidatus Cloacimonadota bacterium]
MTEKEDFIPTPSLAKLYEEQDNYKQALEIYQQLLDKKKDDEFLQKKVEYLQDIIQNVNRKAHDNIESFILNRKNKKFFQISKPNNKQKKPNQNELNKIMKASGDLSSYLADRFSDLTIDQFCSFLVSVLGKNRKLKDIKLSEILNALEKL